MEITQLIPPILFGLGITGIAIVMGEVMAHGFKPIMKSIINFMIFWKVDK